MINLKLRDTNVFGTNTGAHISEYGIRGRVADLTDVCLEIAIKHVLDGVQEGQVLRTKLLSCWESRWFRYFC